MCGESGLSPLQAGAGATVRGNQGTQRSLEAKVISRSYLTIDYKPFGGLITPNEGDLGTLSKIVVGTGGGSAEITRAETSRGTCKDR